MPLVHYGMYHNPTVLARISAICCVRKPPQNQVAYNNMQLFFWLIGLWVGRDILGLQCGWLGSMPRSGLALFYVSHFGPIMKRQWITGACPQQDTERTRGNILYNAFQGSASETGVLALPPIFYWPVQVTWGSPVSMEQSNIYLTYSHRKCKITWHVYF